MSTTLFISDLHLSEQRPEITRLFLQLLQNEAKQADALYILGDFFEIWVGDDNHSPLSETVSTELRNLVKSGIPVYLMGGNRDFLLGRDFAALSGCQLLPDPSKINLYGKPTLLMHGDSLCYLDAHYLKFRAFVQHSWFKALFLKLPLSWRRSLAQRVRSLSNKSKKMKSATIMDVTPIAIQEAMKSSKSELLIHGHTHHPSIHYFMVDDQWANRIVLSDWYQYGNVLYYFDDHHYELINFS